MKKFYLLISSFLIAFFANTQPLSEKWARTGGGAGNDTGIDIACDQAGHIYILGYYTGPSFTLGNVSLTNTTASGAFIAKLDTGGSVIWLKHLATGDTVKASAMAISPDGFIYAAGTFGLTKLDANGNSIWNQATGAVKKMECDSYGDAYCFDGSGFTKYASSGSLIYQRGAPSSNVVDMSIDKSDNVHLLYNTPGNFPSSSRVWYDRTGTLVNTVPMTSTGRFYSDKIKVRFPNDYMLIGRYYNLLPGNGGLQYGHNLQGSASNMAGNPCFRRTPIAPESDGAGNGYFAGIFDVDMCGGVGPQPTSTPIFFGNPGLFYLTGTDIYYIRTTPISSNNFIGSTALCGNTNEIPSKMALDTNSGALYIIGTWSKRADTSLFRFGNTVLTNFGNGTTTDLLLLKFSYPSQPLAVTVGPDRAICKGGSTTLTAVATGGSGNYTYQWSPSTSITSPSIANPVVNPSLPTTYVVTVTDGIGATARDTITITIDSTLYRPTISILAGSNPFCENRSITLGASAGTNFFWSNGQTSQFVSINVPGSYTVRAVDPSGCIGISLPYIVTTRPKPPTPTIQVNGSHTICPGDSRTLTGISTQLPSSYSWSNTATFPPANLGTSQSINIINAGRYTLIVTGANGCSSDDTSLVISSANLPAGIITGNDTTICSGDSVQLRVNTADTVSVLWSNGATTKSIWVKTQGTYSAQLLTSQGCTSNASGTVTVNISSRPTVSISQSANMLTASPAGAAGYQWYMNNTALTGATFQSHTLSAGGEYSVRVTNAGGCSATATISAVYRLSTPSLAYQIFPNPSKDKIRIAYTLNQSKKVSIRVRSQEGKNLIMILNNQQQVAGDYHYSVSTIGLPKGIVFIEFSIGDRIVSHKQLVTD